jgi:hypothetical protein
MSSNVGRRIVKCFNAEILFLPQRKFDPSNKRFLCQGNEILNIHFVVEMFGYWSTKAGGVHTTTGAVRYWGLLSFHSHFHKLPLFVVQDCRLFHLLLLILYFKSFYLLVILFSSFIVSHSDNVLRTHCLETFYVLSFLLYVQSIEMNIIKTFSNSLTDKDYLKKRDPCVEVG